MRKTVTFTDNRDGKSVEFPILEPTLGADVIDIKNLYKEMGLFTYDVGFSTTASCSSDITFIDGVKGELLYRGYPIEDLAEHKNYLDVCFLVLNGELPQKNNYDKMNDYIKSEYLLHEGLKNLFNAFQDNAHPMATLTSTVAALSSFHFEHLDINDETEYKEMAYKIVAKIPTIAAYSYRHSRGLPLIYPDMDEYFTKNFLYMMRAKPNGKADIQDVEMRALDTIFSLHADHEQNASTSTVRAVASTGAHPYAAISAGIGALWGRAHGGANESVISQLELIGDVKNVEKFIKKAKDPKDPFRLMGFGHRVYKNFDPRAKVLKKLRDELKGKIKIDNKISEIADKIEEIALNDDYFIKRNLYPNIDFYSGTILTALKIPKDMFTPIFVIGRTIGWISQWIELKKDKSAKIARPRQLYTGNKKRDIK